ncbi:hypothetical protein GCM10010967_53040 [Dyadobacter beijingensis]|uniref:Uncharacterized protein n=1 Tax=Dyadobacter beijingensis TaxID=365489 RepID=A0ABQ2IHI4_9BACT|nr:hypothetical protein GCM10010967_53040 [Dyadobacter beijingensis]
MRENRIVNALKTRGTRCIAMIISWDNLTSKGIINAAPDLVLVWNKLMADEYEQLYSLFGNVGALRMTGVPRFGIYAKPPDPLKVAVFRGKLGIVPRACVILFSTGAVKHHVCQDYVIEDLLEYARTRPEVVIMVRCHPGDEPGKYERFSGYKNLRFLPSFRQCKEDIPPSDFLETLQIQLAASQVCIQIASTMLLDAAACDKPVISIAYDAHPQVPYRASVRRFYDYAHYQPLRLLLKENIVHDRTALFAKLDALAENGWQAPKWQSVLKTVMNLSTPEPARTTAQCIQEWLDA